MGSIVVMGVSGCGKTAVGRCLAQELGRPFLDADDHHPPANVARMAAGRPLDDAHRWPWLERLGELLAGAAGRGAPVVLACSALRRAHRAVLRDHAPLRFVHLAVPPDVAAARVAGRADHFMPARLVASQFATLEPLDDGDTIDARPPLATVVRTVLTALAG